MLSCRKSTSPSSPRAIIARQARRRRSASSRALKCRAIETSSAAWRLGAPPQQRARAEHGGGDADQERADRGDGRIDLEQETVPDADRQRLHFDARQEQRNQEL